MKRNKRKILSSKDFLKMIQSNIPPIKRFLSEKLFKTDKQLSLFYLRLLDLKSTPSFFFLLQYINSCFTICQFLLYSEVNQLYGYMYPFFFRFPSHVGHHRALSRIPSAIQQALISYLFYTQQCIYVNPSLPNHPTSPSPLGVHMFVLYVWSTHQKMEHIF